MFTIKMQGKTHEPYIAQCPTPATSHHLAEALCSLPNLTDLTLVGGDRNEEFYSTLKANASFLQVCVSQCYCHGVSFQETNSSNSFMVHMYILFCFFQLPLLKAITWYIEKVMKHGIKANYMCTDSLEIQVFLRLKFLNG